MATRKTPAGTSPARSTRAAGSRRTSAKAPAAPKPDAKPEGEAEEKPAAADAKAPAAKRRTAASKPAADKAPAAEKAPAAKKPAAAKSTRPRAAARKPASTASRAKPRSTAAASSATLPEQAGAALANPAVRALSIGALVAAVGGAALGLYRYVTRRPAEGTRPTDLMGDTHPDGSERAIEAFRPDPTAPIPAAERDQFRPALAGAAAPTLVKGQADDLVRTDAAPS
jgi:hypothetical protein